MMNLKKLLNPTTGLGLAALGGGAFFLWKYLQKKQQERLYGQTQYQVPPAYGAPPTSIPQPSGPPAPVYTDITMPAVDLLKGYAERQSGTPAPVSTGSPTLPPPPEGKIANDVVQKERARQFGMPTSDPETHVRILNAYNIIVDAYGKFRDYGGGHHGFVARPDTWDDHVKNALASAGVSVPGAVVAGYSTIGYSPWVPYRRKLV